MIDRALNCVSPPKDVERLLAGIKSANGNKLSCFPDVFAVYSNGKILFREVKSIRTKDRLGPKQHEFANLLRSLFGERVNLGVVEWNLQ